MKGNIVHHVTAAKKYNTIRKDENEYSEEESGESDKSHASVKSPAKPLIVRAPFRPDHPESAAMNKRIYDCRQYTITRHSQSHRRYAGCSEALPCDNTVHHERDIEKQPIHYRTRIYR